MPSLIAGCHRVNQFLHAGCQVTESVACTCWRRLVTPNSVRVRSSVTGEREGLLHRRPFLPFVKPGQEDFDLLNSRKNIMI